MNSRRALVLLMLFSVWPGVAAADQHFIDFEEVEWDAGCASPTSCRGVGYVYGADDFPEVVDAGCVYGRCMLATFRRYDALNFLVPEHDGWVPNSTRFYFEASVKLDSAADLFAIEVSVLEVSTVSGSSRATLALRRSRDGDPLALELSASADPGMPVAGCSVIVPGSASGWHRVRASLDLPSDPKGRGTCTVAIDGTDVVVDTLALPPDLVVSGFERMRVLSSVALSEDPLYPVTVGLDDVCLTETVDSASYCDDERMDRDPRWAPVADAGVIVDGAVDVGVRPDVGAAPDSTAIRPDPQISFRGSGGCACESTGGEGGGAGSMWLIPAALLLFWRRRTSRADGQSPKSIDQPAMRPSSRAASSTTRRR